MDMQITTAAASGPGLPEGKTLGSWVYERLRDDVVSGVLQPGQKLALDALRTRYDVGITPLREALYRLSASLLVVAEDQRGFRVAPASEAHRLEILQARHHIEALALRDAFRHATLEWDGRILTAFHVLKKTPMYQADEVHITRDWEVAHRNFHQAIYSGASSILKHFQSILWDHAARYRNMRPPVRVKGETLHHEHESIVNAIIDRDEEMACMLLRRHILGSSAAAIEALAGLAAKGSGLMVSAST
jgi:GntR family carbon starvation induced transcriptional regulator